MVRKRAQKEEITSGRIMHRLYDSDIYAQLMQIPVPKDGLTNGTLIKSITEDNEAMGQIVGFVEGKIDLISALNSFKMKLGLDPALKRYNEVKDVAERLFLALANAVKNIKGIQEETEIAVSEASEVDETPPVAPEVAGNTRDLEKNVPMELEGVNQVKVTITMCKTTTDHILNISQKNDHLIVGCPTADTVNGKKLKLIVEKGEEFVIGKSENRLFERLKIKLEAAKEKQAEAQKKYDQCAYFSKVSIETEYAERHLGYAKKAVAEIYEELAVFDKDPILQWFDSSASTDISPEHIIIELTDDGKIILTDEGEECSATVEIVG